MRGTYIPDRGHVVWLTFNPQAGHEQAGRRPAVVISPRPYNEVTSLGIFCPITSQVKGYPFEVLIPEGLAVSGVILCDQIKSLDWRVRNATYLCELPGATVADVLAKLKALVS